MTECVTTMLRGYCAGALVRTRGRLLVLRGEEGATAIEYALFAGIIVIAIVATVTAVGIAVDGSLAQAAGFAGN